LIPAQGPSQTVSRPGRPSDGEEMTRYLCAAVTIDKALTDTVLEKVLEEEHRAIAVTPGLDLVTVLKFAIAANRRRMIRDVLLFIILCLLVIFVVTIIGFLFVVPLVIVAWLVIMIERYTSLYGRVARGLRPGAFDPSSAPDPGQGTFAARQLQRVAEAAHEGNVTIYSAYPPFLGCLRRTCSSRPHMVVPPLRESKVDELELAPSFSEFFGMVGSTAVATIPRLFASIPSILHALGSGGRRQKKARLVHQKRDYGALISVREAAADSNWQRYFQKVDDALYSQVVELRILRSLTEFLASHEIDTSSFESQTQTVINNGVTISGNATVVADHIAAGAGAQAGGNIFNRIRGGAGEAGPSQPGGTQ
jgi:hypothetical protein